MSENPSAIDAQPKCAIKVPLLEHPFQTAGNPELDLKLPHPTPQLRIGFYVPRERLELFLNPLLEVAEKAHTKVVLVGDPEQLQAIEAGAPFRGIAAQHGVAELHQVHRQRQEWQRAATGDLAAGRTGHALAAYEEKGAIVAVEERAQARSALLARWARDAKAEPKASQLVLAYTRDDVHELNTAIRTLRAQGGQLGKGQEITTEQGKREFAVHDRIRFGRNEKTLGVKNGSLGTIERIEDGVLQVKVRQRQIAAFVWRPSLPQLRVHRHDRTRIPDRRWPHR